MMQSEGDLDGRDRPRVLVIDDEAGILRAFRRMLERQFDVVTTTSPVEARDRMLGGESFDAILCDVRMPVLTGPALHEEIRALRPSLAARFVFVTATPPHDMTIGERPVLAKPVGRDALLEMVRRVTGVRSTSPPREASRASDAP